MYYKMKKYFYLVAILFIGLAFTSCSDSDDPADNNQEEKDAAMQAITNQYVNNVIFPIYKELATESNNLFNKIVDAKAKLRANTLTQANIDDICATFLKARSAWERSEAFLYGAATDWGIDPHIDTWPLDLTALAKALSNAEIIEDLDDLDNGGIDNVRANVGESQLGFHGIEFILFRDGNARQLAKLQGVEDNPNFEGRNITGEQELIFAAAVAGDLRDKCYQLEVSWLGDAAPKSHVDRVEECEFNTTVGGGNLYYGENMVKATQPGSTYSTWRSVMSTILVAGCSNICAEVAGQKIGQAYLGTDVNYIESPYSKKSYFDFFDNISSIKYSLYGQTSNSVNGSSIMAYLQRYNSDLANKLQTKLNDALSALETAKAGTPFVDDYHSANAKNAMDAINALDDVINEASSWIAAN